MINANELRIGNWVDGGQLGYVQIAEIKKDAYMGEAIPLTPEILLACGFKKWGRDDMPRTISFEYSGMHIFPANCFCNFKGYGFIHYKLSDTIDETNNGITESARFKFEYLHQLQNLYFALTGQELIYKP